MNVQTYLLFNGGCEQAVDFYKEALGLNVEFLQRYCEGRPPHTPDGWGDKFFHATVRIGETLINMSDCLPGEGQTFGGFALLAHMDSESDAETAFEILRDQGKVQMELESTPWAQRFV